MIPVLRPVGGAEELKVLESVIESGWWGKGPKAEQLEKEFAKLVGAKYAVAVNSCTAALHLALEALDIHNKEVISPTITFAATGMAPYYSGNSTVLADVKENDYCIDPEKLPLSKNTGAIIAVHEAGVLADVEKIRKKFKGLIIEDCAHACYVKGAGRKGNIACWSFQAVKTLPAGDGGMVTTDNKRVAERIKRMSWMGITRSTWERAKGKRYHWNYKINELGWKCYMNDLTAAIALVQLKKLKKNLEKRKKIGQIYKRELKNYAIPAPESDTYQYYVIRIKNRNKIADYLARKGINTSVHFKPLHLISFFKGCTKKPLEVAERIWKDFLSLPMHVALSEKDVRYIIACIKEAARIHNNSK